MSREIPICPKCNLKLELRVGRYGPYYACPNYPDGYPTPCDITAQRSKWDEQFRVSDQPTRDARKRAHAAFDRIWHTGQMSRRKAYLWLRDQLEMGGRDCHIQHFTTEQCDRVVDLVNRNFTFTEQPNGSP